MIDAEALGCCVDGGRWLSGNAGQPELRICGPDAADTAGWAVGPAVVGFEFVG